MAVAKMTSAHAIRSRALFGSNFPERGL